MKLSRRIMALGLLLVGLLFYSRVYAITVILTPTTEHVVARMWPVFSYDDEDEDGDSNDDGDDYDDADD